MLLSRTNVFAMCTFCVDSARVASGFDGVLKYCVRRARILHGLYRYTAYGILVGIHVALMSVLDERIVYSIGEYA